MSTTLTAAPAAITVRRRSATGPGAGALALRTAVIGYLLLLVVVPLAALVAMAFVDGPVALMSRLSDPIAIDALYRTLWTAALMTGLNAVFGTATAWVLVRYRFPGRAVLSSLIDLPFAIPTLVIGLMLVLLFGPQQPTGRWLAGHGVTIAFATPAIVLALMLVTLPLVVRAVEPVLRELDPAEEEAAHTLGASRALTFLRVLLPPLLPAIGAGALQSFARATAEFGSIIVVSGNIPFRTLTAPVQIFSDVESGRPESAAAVSLVLLALALVLSGATRALRRVRGASS